MCSKQGLKSFQKHSQARRKRQGYILLLRGGRIVPDGTTKELEEREFALASGAVRDQQSWSHEDIEESDDGDDGGRGANK